VIIECVKVGGKGHFAFWDRKMGYYHTFEDSDFHNYEIFTSYDEFIDIAKYEVTKCQLEIYKEAYKKTFGLKNDI
jgi:hypothetical protein